MGGELVMLWIRRDLTWGPPLSSHLWDLIPLSLLRVRGRALSQSILDPDFQ